MQLLECRFDVVMSGQSHNYYTCCCVHHTLERLNGCSWKTGQEQVAIHTKKTKGWKPALQRARKMTAFSRAGIALARAALTAALWKSCKFSSPSNSYNSYFQLLWSLLFSTWFWVQPTWHYIFHCPVLAIAIFHHLPSCALLLWAAK